MKSIKILLIYLPLLFFGLFLLTDKVLANSYQDSIVLTIPSATNSGNVSINENGMAGFTNPSTYQYPFGSSWSSWNGAFVINGISYSSWENWQNAYYNGYTNAWSNVVNSGIWGFTAGSTINTGYYNPGYYMIEVDYPVNTMNNGY